MNYREGLRFSSDAERPGQIAQLSLPPMSVSLRGKQVTSRINSMYSIAEL